MLLINYVYFVSNFILCRFTNQLAAMFWFMVVEIAGMLCLATVFDCVKDCMEFVMYLVI
jgi:hypothetical protein